MPQQVRGVVARSKRAHVTVETGGVCRTGLHDREIDGGAAS